MCSCDVDLEPVAVCEIRRITARKEHRCDECREPIKRGGQYVRIKALFDGRWENGKRCVGCHLIAQDYCCGVIGRGAVWEWCREHLGVDLVTGETFPLFGGGWGEP